MTTITVKMNTSAPQCDSDATFSRNIRPNVFFRETVCEVVKAGSAPARGFARGYNWYVVRYGSGYAFVTQQDVI
jgi:hypothetical protein